MGIEKPRPMPSTPKPHPPSAPPTFDKLHKTNIQPLSSDKEVIVFISFAASKQLTGEHSSITVKNKEEDVNIDPIFISGNVEEVKTLLHVRIDEWMDTYYESIKNKKGPIVWSPAGKI